DHLCDPNSSNFNAHGAWYRIFTKGRKTKPNLTKPSTERKEYEKDKVKINPSQSQPGKVKDKSQAGNPLHYYWPMKSMIMMKDLGLKGKSKAEIRLGYPLTQQAQQLEALSKETQPH
ncbi:hypothetical protein Tco_0081532, partial [Tanacetum coccineum]